MFGLWPPVWLRVLSNFYCSLVSVYGAPIVSQALSPDVGNTGVRGRKTRLCCRPVAQPAPPACGTSCLRVHFSLPAWMPPLMAVSWSLSPPVPYKDHTSAVTPPPCLAVTHIQTFFFFYFINPYPRIFFLERMEGGERETWQLEGQRYNH